MKVIEIESCIKCLDYEVVGSLSTTTYHCKKDGHRNTTPKKLFKSCHLPDKQEKGCEWECYPGDDYYETACGEYQHYMNIGFKSSWKFCPYCGNKIKVKL